MRALVYAFYDHQFSFRKLVDHFPELGADLTDCLIGNLDRDFGPLVRGLGAFARLPERLPYGRPLIAHATSPLV